MPQLDSLRAFAVGAIMLMHYDPDGLVATALPLRLGVELFFVLSGYLITGILLRGTPTAEFVVSFYMRRALRLFPLYYTALAVVLLVSQEARGAWTYYAFYGINFWVAEHRYWGVASHFWSLAVEEQFYFLWPFVILWTPRHLLVRICVAVIVGALAFRVMAVVALQNDYATVLLPGRADALACGAILALKGAPRLSLRYGIFAVLSALAVILCHAGPPELEEWIIYSLALPAFYWLVSASANGIGGIAGSCLSLAPLQYLGRISYGIYVIHYLVLGAMTGHIYRYGPTVRAASYCIITVGLAALSWHYLEAPINRARDRLPMTLFAKWV